MSPDRHDGDFFNDVVATIKRMTLIQGAGHFVAFMQPDEFLRKLLVDVRPLADRRNLITIEQA